MTAVFVLLAIIVLVGAAFVLTGRWDPGMRPAQRPTAPELPTPLTPQSIRAARFRVGLRGYRMEDVDALLAAIATQWESSDGPTPSQDSVIGRDASATPPAG